MSRCSINHWLTYKTRSGLDAKYVHYVPDDPIYPVRAQVNGVYHCFTERGHYQYGSRETNALDLIEYNPKPKMLSIAGSDGKYRSYPEPCRIELQDEQIYFVACATDTEMTHHVHWSGDECDIKYLERGLIHLTKEAAQQHAKAMLGFD